MRGFTRIVALVILALLCALLIGCPPKAAPPGAGTGAASATPEKAPPAPAEPEKASGAPDESEKAAGAPAEAQKAPASAAGLTWVTSFAEGSKTAAAEKKPMMVDFYTDWCGWCKKLDEETYTDATVVEKSREFVCVKVDAEKDKPTADKYKVEGFPTILFLDSSGAKIHEVVGYEAAGEFAADMDKALSTAKGGG
jgi:thiol-disulfide isomerase/thioredoxin